MAKQNEQSKYMVLREYLRDEILMGRILPGSPIPSENTLSDKFSLSRHTVRKAISILVNEGYLQTEHGRGTYCVDRSRRRSESKNIAVITTYISEYIFPGVIQGIDGVLSQNGYSIILKNTGNDSQKEADCLQDILLKDIEGLIVEPTRSSLFSNNIGLYEALDKNNIPYVFIHGYYQQLSNKPCVLLDDMSGMYNLVKYLISLGHKEIIGIYKADDIQGINRHKGYAKAISEGGLIYNPDNVIWFHTEDKDTKPYSTISSMLESGKTVDAVACYNDEVAFKLIETLIASGKRVPEDLSITGFDDSYLSLNCPVKLTTACHPKESLGVAAAELLLDLIKGNDDGSGTKTKIIQPEVVIRNSCAKKQ